MPRQQEDGAIAVLVALLVCVLMVPLAAVAVDLGVQRVARRDMQSLSDVVALDLGRDLDGRRDTATVLTAWGCSVTAGGNCTAASGNRVGRSVARNPSTTGSAPQVVAQLGCTDSTGTFHAVDVSCTKPTAVKVASSTSVKFGFTDQGPGGATRTAIGQSRQIACYYLGSFAARFDSSDSDLVKQVAANRLNELLGVNLDLVSYKGLGVANLSLADLAATSTIGGVDKLVSGSVTVGQLLSAAFEVLNHQNDPKNSAALQALQALQATTALNQQATLQLGSLLGLTSGDDAALATNVDVLDLVAGSIAIANGQNFLALTDLAIPGVVDPHRNYVKVIEGPMRFCQTNTNPDAQGSSSQVAVHLESTLPVAELTGLTCTSGDCITGYFTIDGGVASSTAAIIGSVHCGSGTSTDPDTYTVRVTPGLAGLTQTVDVYVKGSSGDVPSLVVDSALKSLLQSVLGLVLGLLDSITKVQYDLDVHYSQTNALTGAPKDLPLQVPLNALNTTPQGTPQTASNRTPITVPSLGAATVTGTVTVTTLLKGQLAPVAVNAASVQPLLDALTSGMGSNSSLSNLTSSLNSKLADVDTLLGLSMGGADTYSHARPECHGSELIG